jgi:4-amino-4-deoxy-L-arabinose transferase-like glycosyltransferase
MNKFKRVFTWIHLNKYLFLILLLAVLLRFLGTNPGYSHYHSDEPVTYGTAITMIKNNTLDPGRYDYPAPVMVILIAFFRYVFIPLQWLGFYTTHIGDFVDGLIKFPLTTADTKRIFQNEILGIREINALYWARYVTALFSFGCVVLIYKLGKKMFKTEIGILAAFFLTLNFRHVLNAHISLPDIYNAFFLLLSLVITYSLYQKPTKKMYFLAGIAAGVSVAIKYQTYALLPLALVHLYLSFDGKKLNVPKLFNPHAISSALLVPLTFLLCNPYIVINADEAIRWSHIVFQKYGVGANAINLFIISYIYHFDFGPPLFIFSIIGVVVMVKRWQKFLFLISPILIFLYMFTYSSNGGFYVRNIIPITPLLLLYAAYGVLRIFEILKIKSPALKIIILLTLVYIPGRNSIINTYYNNRRDWNFNVMADWLKQNLPSDAVVAAVSTDVPGGPKMNKTEFELDGNFSLQEHKDAGANWILMNTDWASGNFYNWMSVRLDSLSNWNKPLLELRNTYHGIAIEEIARYQVFSAMKPWQAPDSNLILAKIPEWPEVQWENIKSYNFDSKDGEWVIDQSDDENIFFELDKEKGRGSNGSIMFTPVPTDKRNIRVSSDPIQIKGGHLYKINGYLLTEKYLNLRERQGFLRVDFFDNLTKAKGLGDISSVSSRAHSSDDWVKREIIERAPNESKYMVVSFQVAHNSDTNVWIDDIEIFESVNSVENITSMKPYNFKPIDYNSWYPISHGNL